MKENTTFKTSKTPSETLLTNRIISVLHTGQLPLVPQNSRYISSEMRPVHTAEGKEQLGEPPCTCSRTSVAQPGLLFLFYTVVIHFCLFPSSKILIRPDLFFFFISLVPTFHCLPWQTLLVLSTFNLRRAGGATKSKGHIQYLRWASMLQEYLMVAACKGNL